MTTNDAMNLIKAVNWYGYNQIPSVIIEEVYGDIHQTYADEKLDLLKRMGILYLFNALDKEHKVRFVRAVQARYPELLTLEESK